MSLRRRRRLDPAAVPVVSVGNLAFGGRAKTPLVLALAAAAQAEGLRVGVLSRGYGRSGKTPHTLEGRSTEGVVWARPVLRHLPGSPPAERAAWSLAPESGDEPAWLAASAPGLLVHVDADRSRGARAIADRVDLLLLDDGFQHPLPRSYDLVVATADDLEHRGWLREPASALGRADRVVRLGLDVSRAAGATTWLDTGAPCTAPLDVAVLAGVGDPASVAALARTRGLRVVATHPVRDHRAPDARLRRTLRPPDAGAFLITEKDAIGWAAADPPPGPTLVLGQRLVGASELWPAIREAIAGA